MIINKINIEGLNRAVRTDFNKAFMETPSTWAETTMRIPATGASTMINWMSNFPKLREWIGDKQLSTFAAFKYIIEHKNFEATIEVSRDDLEDDESGLYAASIQAKESGVAAREWADDLSAILKNNAFVDECYDGQYFYDTDHPVGDDVNMAVTTYSNKGTAALSVATQAAAEASYGVGRLSIMSRVSNEGRLLNLVPYAIEGGPALETKMNLLFKVDKFADLSPNPFMGQCKVIVNPRLTSATQWMIHAKTAALKPFIFLERKKPTFMPIDRKDEFMRAIYYMGIEARGNGAYGLPQLSYGSTGAA